MTAPTGGSFDRPSSVAGYRILATIGHGSSAVVYRATQPRTQRTVALKVLRHDSMSDTARERHRLEAGLLADLDHPGIARLYESGAADLGFGEVPFFAMELIEGQPFDELLGSERPGREAVLERFIEISEAIEHVHRRGIIHRDLKLRNVMITTGSRAVVLDFGIARRIGVDAATLSMQTGTDEFLGTLPYMSPETLQGSSAPSDHRVDVFALGAMLGEALTGRPPFELQGLSLARALQVVAEDEPSFMKSLEGDLAVIVGKAMAREKEERYPTAEDFAEDLRRVLAGRPIFGRPPGAARRMRRFARRNRVILAAAVALLLALLVGIVLVVREIRTTDESLARFELISTISALEDARSLASTLHPPVPRMAPALRSWLDDTAAPLVALEPHLRRTLSVVEAKSEAAGDARSRVVLADRFLRDRLREAVTELEELSVPETGLVARMKDRLAWSESVRTLTIDDHRGEWERAIESIRRSDGVAASALYGGLEISPQIGLIPLGPDPKSGLWEFGHLRSGPLAVRDPQTGELRFEEETGLVLVLIPPGTFLNGSQREDPAGPNYDPDGSQSELTLQEITLDAFFLSKFEMTQAQWRRLSRGEEPSEFRRGSTVAGHVVDGSFPVESISWIDCDRLLRSEGLLLPTEAQWEYAARAGTDTPWWTGRDKRSLAGTENIADRTLNVHQGGSWKHEEWLDDGYALAAPVHLWRGNPFGLHLVMGNVDEWVRDWRMVYANSKIAPGDGERRGTNSGERSVRGGSFASRAFNARVSKRGHLHPGHRQNRTGCRPSRALDGPPGP